MGALSLSRLAAFLLRLTQSRTQFHYECVGLKSAPKGEWYCDDCMVVLNIDPKTMKPATS